jgi:hypothetical protein
VRASPLRCLARGPRVPLIAAASAWVCVLAEDPPGDAPPAVVREEVVTVEVLFERVAGLDIGKNSLTVCRRTPGAGGRRISETRTFPTTTRALNVMRNWLLVGGVTIAAMESTSTYWKAPFYCLEEVMEAWLLNAAHMKAVEIVFLILAILCPANAENVRIAAAHGHGNVQATGLAGVDRRRRAVCDQMHAAVLSNGFEHHFLGILVTRVGDLNPVAGGVAACPSCRTRGSRVLAEAARRSAPRVLLTSESGTPSERFAISNSMAFHTSCSSWLTLLNSPGRPR